MFDYKLIIIEDDVQLAVELQTTEEVSKIEAGLIAAEMLGAVEWWRNYDS